MQRYMVIVAGGAGKRMGSDIPKQFLPINGKPLLMRTIERIKAYDNAINIVLVLPETQFEYWNLLCKEYGFQIPLKLVAGGQERFFSVKNALDYIPGDSIVGIHDGVRPFVSNQTLNRLFASLQKNNAVIPAVPPHESVRIEDDAKNTMLDRNKVKLVQTPQCFKSDVIKEAYNTIYKPFFTDDASVVEYALKMPITIVDGNRENIKITTPLDLMMAELIYENFG